MVEQRKEMILLSKILKNDVSCFMAENAFQTFSHYHRTNFLRVIQVPTSFLFLYSKCPVVDDDVQ